MAAQRAGLRAPSKVQRGRVGIPGDFSVLEVRAVEITELVYELAPKNLVHESFTVSESPYPPKGPPSIHKVVCLIFT